MNDKITLRKTEQGDTPLLETLYREAFTDEDLVPLVLELLNDTQNTLNLSALVNGKLVSHIAFTKCHASPDNIPLSLLGPLAVLPSYQRKGIGSQLIQEGFNLLKEYCVAKIIVFGDPNYYGRSGFVEESKIDPAYKIREDYKSGWQSISFSDDSVTVSGRLKVTKPWQREELWSE